MIHKIKTSVDFLHKQGFENPEIGVILGTGLGKFINQLNILKEISYQDIPHFSASTVEYHAGKLIFGELEGKRVIVMHGRFHLYEGYTLEEVTYPVRVLKALGVHTLLVSNAAGAVNLSFKKGELMLVEDHINLQGGSPLAFKGVEKLGERFIDMSEPYDSSLLKELESIAKEQNITIKKGVYASVVGPQLETRAEYRMLTIIGADAVGMSTVPEVIVAKQLGLKIAAISVLTDECDPDNLSPINIPEIMSIVEKSEPNLVHLFTQLIKNL
ncbi:MAG TPA: purine-nucleoside phosphorylase [Bacteroidetes bacterium]|nr:purine-nucleoside phosphorylase [Bacteroidota bacterium]